LTAHSKIYIPLPINAKGCHNRGINARKFINSRTGRALSSGRQIHRLPIDYAEKNTGIQSWQPMEVQEEVARRLVKEKLQPDVRTRPLIAIVGALKPRV
jgi:hypothetical protein